jgi:hypothetical protein
MRSIVIIVLFVALSACQSEHSEPSTTGAAPPPQATQPNLLQTQTDALQKAKNVQAEMDAAEAKRREAMEEAAGG